MPWPRDRTISRRVPVGPKVVQLPIRKETRFPAVAVRTAGGSSLVDPAGKLYAHRTSTCPIFAQYVVRGVHCRTTGFVYAMRGPAVINWQGASIRRKLGRSCLQKKSRNGMSLRKGASGSYFLAGSSVYPRIAFNSRNSSNPASPHSLPLPDCL